MNDIVDHVEHLEKKIQKLVSYHHLLRESNNKLAEENKKLADLLEKETQRVNQAKHESTLKHRDSVNTKELKLKVENIIRELDNSINLLSNQSESTL